MTQFLQIQENSLIDTFQPVHHTSYNQLFQHELLTPDILLSSTGMSAGEYCDRAAVQVALRILLL